MKFMMKWSALAFGVLMLMSAASAQSPREQLNRMVEQLAGNPSNAKLREDIIGLQRQIKPPPSIPEAAQRALARGNTMLKEATDRSGYERAIGAFSEAVRYAPWWADAYYNLSVGQESADKFDDAISSLKFYLLAVPPGADTSAAHRRLGALDVKKVAASTQSFEGFWRQEQFQNIETKQWVDKNPSADNTNTLVFRIWKNGRGGYEVRSPQDDDGDPNYESVVAERDTIQWFNPGDKEDCSSTPCGVKMTCRRTGEGEMECLFQGMGFKQIQGGVTSVMRLRRLGQCVPLGYKKEDNRALRCQ